MELKIKFKWSMLEIPPRCRKARDVPHYKDAVATIREISGADADRLMPVALIVHDELYKDKYPDTQATHKPLYWYQGNLYAKDNRHTIDRLVDEFARDVQNVDKEAFSSRTSTTTTNWMTAISGPMNWSRRLMLHSIVSITWTKAAVSISKIQKTSIATSKS